MASLASAASSFYVEIAGQQYTLLSVSALPQTGPVAGNQKATGRGQRGETRSGVISGFATFDRMTITCSLTSDGASKLLWTWMDECAPKPEGKGLWKSKRQDGSVVGVDGSLTEVKRWNFFKAWPKNWSLQPADVTNKELMVESWELVAEKIKEA